MKSEENLEQLESSKCLPDQEEIVKRLYLVIHKIGNLTFDDLCNTQEALVHCGFSFFEALYLICGEEIQNCSLLSSKTKQTVKNIILDIVLKEAEGLKETWKNQLGKIIGELDEIILLHQLQEDSKRLKKLLILIKDKTDRKVNHNA